MRTCARLTQSSLLSIVVRRAADGQMDRNSSAGAAGLHAAASCRRFEPRSWCHSANGPTPAECRCYCCCCCWLLYFTRSQDCVLIHTSRMALTTMETPACSRLRPFSNLICRPASFWTQKEAVCLPPVAVTEITQTNVDEAVAVKTSQFQRVFLFNEEEGFFL